MFIDTKALHKIFINSTGITTDTRNINKGDIFFALKGDNFNGNTFAKKALELGAKYVIIDEPQNEINKQYLLVDNVLESLQALANHHRKKFDIPVIGITGTNGKTTTKELIANVLQTSFKIHFTKGNLNNHIGVPLTLLSMPLDTEIAIIEMGANHIGDIKFLCDIAEPTHGLITNIGKAHLEGFGSLEGVARTKSELYKHLLEHDGIIFINGENEILSRMATRFSNPLVYSYSDPNVYCYASLLEVNPYIKLSYNEEQNKQTSLIGKYNFENILAAFSIAKFFNISDSETVTAICAYTPTNNRSQVIEKGNNKILLDAYNANPTSMGAAIDNFEAIKHNKKTLILGDMFELGPDSNMEHLNIYNLIISKEFDTFYFVGSHFHQSLPKQVNTFETKDNLIKHLNSHPIQDSLILIKGSRGIGLESILDHL